MTGTVIRSADGSISWHAQRAAALGPVIVELDESIQVAVDAAFPDEILDLSAASPEALRVHADRFADPTVVEALAAASDGSVAAAPRLAPAWVRVATVAAVDAVHLGDLDDAVLLLDAAHARAVAADPDADRHYAVGAAVIDRLLDEITSGGHRGPFVDRTAATISAASPRVFPDARRAALLARLAPADAATDHLWREFLADVAAHDAPLALALSRPGADAQTDLSDLAVLPPRLLRFDGPDEPDVQVQVIDADTVEVTATARTHVDAAEADGAGIFAVAADASSGDLIAHAPAVFGGGQFSARLRIGGVGEPSLRFAFIGSSARLDALQLGSQGAALTRIDRYCRYAWTQHRLVGALRSSVGADASTAEIEHAAAAATTAAAIATEAATTARALTRQLLRRATDSGGLRRYGETVTRLHTAVQALPQLDGPTGPTLAELHAVARG